MRIKKFVDRSVCAFKVRSRQLSGVLLVASMPAVSFAQDTGTGVDVSDSTAKIAAWLAGAILVSVAMTAAVIAIRASKLPRRGA